MRRLCKVVILICLSGSLVACSTVKQDPTSDWSADQLFQAAKTSLNAGSYKTAGDYYTKLLARYPFGQLAQQSMLDLAYAYYRDGEAEKAQVEIDNFIRTYPQHPYIDYAYYMRGVVAYEKDVSIYDRLNPINLAQTDAKSLQVAFNAFDELVRRFPDSEYSEDARYRMLYLKNLMAQHELEIASYYMRKGAYIAAVNRAKIVLERFEQSPSTPYALAIMTRAYQELNQSVLAQNTRRVLELNFASQLNDPEIQNILNEDITKKRNLWDMLTAKPKI